MNSPASPQPNRVQQHLQPGAQPVKSTPHAEMVRLRTQVYGSCPHFSDPAMARFVASCFESDATVHAYFKPMPLPVLARGRILTGRTVKAVPLTQALRAVNGYQHRRKSGGQGIQRNLHLRAMGVLEGARRASANSPMARGAGDLGVVN